MINNILSTFMKLPLKSRITIIGIIIILIILPLSLILLGQKQELRKKAAGSYEVDLIFDTASKSYKRGDTIQVDIRLSKTAQRNILASGAQAVVRVSDKLKINTSTCLSPFNGLSSSRIDGQNVTYLCGIPLGVDPQSISLAGITFARLNMTVNSNAAFGDAPLSFVSTRVTEAGIQGQAPDVSTGGQALSLTIVDNNQPTITSAPTVTQYPGTTVIPTINSPAVRTKLPKDFPQPMPTGPYCPQNI